MVIFSKTRIDLLFLAKRLIIGEFDQSSQVIQRSFLAAHIANQYHYHVTQQNQLSIITKGPGSLKKTKGPENQGARVLEPQKLFLPNYLTQYFSNQAIYEWQILTKRSS